MAVAVIAAATAIGAVGERSIYNQQHETRSIQTGARESSGLLLGTMQTTNLYEEGGYTHRTTPGEQPEQLVALPLQGAAAGLGMSHQPAAPYTGDARMEKRCLGSLINSTSSGSTPDCATNLTPWQLFEEFEQFDYDLAYHPGETIEPTPTPSVVQVATVRAAAQGGSLTEVEMVAVLTEAGAPEEWIPPLLTIAFCESRWSPYAVGDGGNSLGMFQLWYGWARPMGYAPDDLFDPVKAARTALYVREVRGRFGGAGGWTCADLRGIY